MTEPFPADIRPGFRFVMWACSHCFNHYCYCTVGVAEIRQARELVDYRHKMSVARAKIGTTYRDEQVA
jgi:hypothetical protein